MSENTDTNSLKRTRGTRSNIDPCSESAQKLYQIGSRGQVWETYLENLCFDPDCNTMRWKKASWYYKQTNRIFWYRRRPVSQNISCTLTRHKAVHYYCLLPIDRLDLYREIIDARFQEFWRTWQQVKHEHVHWRELEVEIRWKLKANAPIAKIGLEDVFWR